MFLVTAMKVCHGPHSMQTEYLPIVMNTVWHLQCTISDLRNCILKCHYFMTVSMFRVLMDDNKCLAPIFPEIHHDKT